MTKEELLKPRYKTLAEDTSGNLVPGRILTYSEEFNAFFCESSITSADQLFILNDNQLKLYPHLFKKLEWWQEREEYFWLAPGEQRRPLFVSNIGKTVYGSAWGVNLLDGSFTLEVSGNPTKANLTNYIPATEEEYNAYNSQKQ